MSDGTSIEWTEATWNPVTGCSVVSPGCTNCYAMQLAGTRLAHHSSRAGLTRDTGGRPKWTGEVRFNAGWLTQPLRWRRARRIFVCAHGDLFHEAVPDEWIDQVFAVMALAPRHTFQVLTKRSARMREYLTDPQLGVRIVKPAYELLNGKPLEFGRWPLPNVWLGVSVEDHARADERIPDLLATPAAVRWLSCEPLLGPVDLTRLGGAVDQAGDRPAFDALGGEVIFGSVAQTGGISGPCPRLDWIVAGGESGPGARPMHPAWARGLRDQCAAAGVPFFFKQWGEWAPGAACLGKIGRFPAADHGRNGWMRFDHFQSGDEPDCPPDVVLWGKKAAGRLLDGVAHDGFPA